MTEKIALDTNVILYMHDNNAAFEKRVVSEALMKQSPMVSAQIISEYLNVCLKKLKMEKELTIEIMNKWLVYCEFAKTSPATYKQAASLIKKYDLQIFDSIIVAAAIESGCAILYSEDMQDGQVIEGKLTIVNPFLFSSPHF